MPNYTIDATPRPKSLLNHRCCNWFHAGAAAIVPAPGFVIFGNLEY